MNLAHPFISLISVTYKPLLMFLLFSVALIILSCISQHASAARYSGNEIDHFALQELKRLISDDPHGLLNSWNHSVHHCNWLGVTCNARHRRVTALTLRGQSLFGSISPYLGNISFLKSIEFDENRFYGEIPKEIGSLLRLKHLNLWENMLTGHIPSNLSYCSELVSINARNNRLTGHIPKEWDSLKNLLSINLHDNNFTGNIPSSLGNLSSLEGLFLSYNHLEGHLPNELGKLTKLSFFVVSENLLTGTFPPSLWNISTLIIISTKKNYFHGSVPTDIGLLVPNLQVLSVCGNKLSGIIPNSIANATKLVSLCLSKNNFHGKVPTNLGNLPNLRRLGLAENLFGRNSVVDMAFISSLTNCSMLEILIFSNNNFGGELPKIIGNLSSQMQKLNMGMNQMSGAIPLELGNLHNLYNLRMQFNSFSGNIPTNFGGFQKLQGLYIQHNRLSGLIPSTIYSITSLYILNLQNNYIEGTIPPSLGNCSNLQIVDFSHNKLTGPIPATIFNLSFSPILLDLSHNSLVGSLPFGQLKNLHTFNVSYNILSGEIPGTLGDCSSLEYLNMEGNSFRGSIPKSLVSLKGLQYLDLSQNHLTGEIPRDIEGLKFLKFINLSFNDLEGAVPSNGVFRNTSSISLEGNNKLCGGIPEVGLHPCIVQKHKNKNILVIIVISVLMIVMLLFTMLFLRYRSRVKRNRQSIAPQMPDKFINVSFHELHRATGEFSQDNLIGSGGFGVVYKGVLDKFGDRLVAVKVLDLQKNGASASFKAECKALRNIRHRNLARIITYCSSIDGKGQEFKALVYEFMPNGNLDERLHLEPYERETPRNLNFIQRLNIAIDVATALDYLHNRTHVPIVHCDLKPSNILLDNDLTAHVGDFGLARLLVTSTEDSFKQGTSSSIAIKGSIGYAAPEYGMGGDASTEGDMYSYGILLLEIFTGRRPTDDTFDNGLDLHNFVKMNIPEQVMKIVDQSLGEENINVEQCDIEIGTNENIGVLLKCFISIFKVGLKCSATITKDRLNMNEAMRELVHIKDAFLCAKNSVI